ncbi:MAG: elongation factor P maturation arginine rhamnosyltransferase EarP, partial [Polaromonas sp.]|nr:elongation factor P maturation arginine rhamnosyltransferase EarP [Polaromonas sp.]
LEYLSAEAYAGRSHALPSPVAYGPGAGATKWFFYPGFTSETGGLLRELSLSGQQDAFDADAWLARFGGAREDAKPEQHISLFCYEPTLLRALLEQLAASGLHGAPVRLMVTAGRASAAVRGILKTDRELLKLTRARGLLSLTHLEPLSQIDFDRLLWACAVNFVRGEDSLVRSLWAGRPFVWQAYPQTDDTHLGKVEAFLAMLEAPVSMRNFYRSWNGAVDTLPMLDAENWRSCVANAKASLLGQLDLTSQLLSFVAGKQAEHPTP